MIAQNIRHLVRIINRHFSHAAYAFDGPLPADLLETAFLASTMTDEGRHVRCSISVFDVERGRTDAPETLRMDRWSVFPLADPLPLTPEHLARIAQAVRPHAGALAVCPTPEKRWSIWAIIDQEHLIRGFRQHTGQRFYPRAGRFHVEVDGPGCMALYHNSVVLARLQRDSPTKDFQDVFHQGPLAEALDKLAEEHLSRVVRPLQRWPVSRDGLGHHRRRKAIGVPASSVEVWFDRAKQRWLAALSGVLLEMRQLHHGGALLVILRATLTHLKVKDKIEYRRVEEALAERCASEVMALGHRHFGLETDDDEQVRLVLPELEEAERRHADAVRAEAGALRFIASLSGVDGLILAVRGMRIHGFGAETLAGQDPKMAWLAADASGSTGEPIDPTRWGTRHRSMMRYCARHQGSLGFVVSQDGDVRAMMRVAERLLVWPNIGLERSATLPFEIPCEQCSSVGEMVPIRRLDEDETDPLPNV